MAIQPVWVFAAFAILSFVAAEKCPQTSDIQTKQQKLVEILSYVNRPYVKWNREKQPLNPQDEEILHGKVGLLNQREVYSVFDERYWGEANASLYYLLRPQSFNDFVKAAEVLRQYVNEDLFHYVFLVATTHREDTRGVVLPRVHDSYPDKFFKTDVITQIKAAALLGRKDIVVDDTEEDYDYRNPYSLLSYFLEDLGMNSHHYHWHVQNSLLWSNRLQRGGAQTLQKDRYGEAFYWMHHQMVNRFDAELLSNRLPRVTPYENWDDPIEEGYASHLTVDRHQYRYMYRPPGLVLRDLPEMTRNQMRQWRDRVLVAIHKGYVTTRDGRNVTLNDPEGIDILSHLLESTVESINRPLYGNVHSYAHVIAARVADPDQRYGEDYGAMYDVTTSARDPLFYRWHRYVDNILQSYKNTLPHYTENDLLWNDVKVESVTVEGSKINKIKTYWEDETVTIGKGYSYTGDSSASVKIRHLQHEEFNYNIQINNNAGSNRRAVIRVYLAPKYNEKGHELSFEEQRRSVIELDRFSQELVPGKNTVTRKSVESSVTQSNEQIFADPQRRQQQDHCSCGWPNYLLVPRGSYEGTEFQVYVVVSNYDEDHVESDQSCYCGQGYSYCGVLYGKYPDRRPFGYPFDRQSDARSFDEFKTQNMVATDVSIQFTGNIKKSS